MATIQEILRLEDQFSSTMTSYLRLAQQSQRQTQAINEATHTLTSVLRQQGQAQLSAQIQADIATAQLRRQQTQMNHTANSANNLTSALYRLGGAYFGIRGITAITGLSDELVSVNARLNLINDGLQTTAALQSMIYQAAERSRGSYMAMQSTVSKLGLLAGDAFESAQEMVAFTELLNKNFVIGGASAQEQTAAMYQLTQAMASGRLQGDEYRSIIENAPLLAQAIEDYMRNVQGATGSMKDWASQGLLTSDVIKAAMFNAADEVEERFAAMPKTWAQTWQAAKNISVAAFRPLLNVVGMAADFVGNNIEPFIGGFYGLAAAVGVYAVQQAIATIAAAGFTAVLRGLLPQVAIFTAIGAAIGLLISYLGGASAAVGALAGAFATAGAFIWNTFIGLVSSIMQALWAPVSAVAGVIDCIVNAFQGGFDSVWDGFKNLIGELLSGLLSFGKTATGIIDTIFGTHTTDKVTEWQRDLAKWGKNEKAIDFHVADMDPANYMSKYRIEYGDAWNAGNNFGKNLAEQLGWGKVAGASDYSQYAGNIANNLAGIAGDTKAIKNSVDTSDETLKMLMDMAERRYVNNINLTAQSPVITVQGQNTGDTMADRYKLADALKEVLLEQASAGATRSTAMAF